MGKLYNFLGLSVGVNPGMPHSDKRRRRRHHLRHQQRIRLRLPARQHGVVEGGYVQRGLNFAIVDEVDSILIDEGAHAADHLRPGRRIAGDCTSRSTASCPRCRARRRKRARATTGSTRSRSRCTCPRRAEHAEELLRKAGILGTRTACTRPHNIHVVHHLNAGLRRAHLPARRGLHRPRRRGGHRRRVHRPHPGRRRWSDGLHQAVEAKEGVPVQRENQTSPAITFQNLFRMYAKVRHDRHRGYRGLRVPEIYGLEVVVIPTHRPMVRRTIRTWCSSTATASSARC